MLVTADCGRSRSPWAVPGTVYDNKAVRVSGLVAPGLLAVVFLAGRTLFASPFAQGQPADLERTLITIQQSIAAGNLDGARHSIAMALERHPDEAGLLNL